MTSNEFEIRAGMPVVGSDATIIGRVKEFSDGDFRIDRPLQADVLLPRSAIKVVSSGMVILVVRASQVEDLAMDFATDDEAA